MNYSLENLDHKALCALNLSFIEKLRCFAFGLDSTHIAIATDPDNPPDMELVKFHIHKQFPNLALECTPINDFELFYQKALANARFTALTQSLCANLTLLQGDTETTSDKSGDIGTILTTS